LSDNGTHYDDDHDDDLGGQEGSCFLTYGERGDDGWMNGWIVDGGSDNAHVVCPVSFAL
jgi:hypothetical protein